MIRRTMVLLMAMCIWVAAVDLATQSAVTEGIRAAEIYERVSEFSSPAYEGRLTGTTGYARAARRAADLFREWGLAPLSEDYLQEFSVRYTEVRQASLTLRIQTESREEVIEGEYFSNFYPLNFSGHGTVAAPVVFAGYGLSAPEYGHDDYAGLAVTDKIVMIIKGAPPPREGEDWTVYDDHRFRTANARRHGAAGLLYIYRPVANPNGDHLENFPMVQISTEMADAVLKASGTSVEALKPLLNLRRNVSFVTKATADLAVQAERRLGTGYNVVAFLPGSDPERQKEAVVIGAHLDHTGAWPVLTPGADDNASGVAVVLAIARAMAQAGVRSPRSIVFVLFGGEEMGLLGSRRFAERPPAPIQKIHFVLNTDMVGAGPDIFVLGLKKDPRFELLANRVKDSLGLTCRLEGNERIGSSGADHGPFIEKGIPAVSVFSSGGDHHGYHTDQDTIYWITPRIMEDIGRLVAGCALELARGE
ncbi:MAG: M20/M25/M40 family metallo-hydrolase [Acidobacteria bacterium]|nr:M20/M25/M40 family metallo-hydrolase [Acidobacteriota bacterium]